MSNVSKPSREKSVEELKQQLTVSVTESMRLIGLGRHTVDKLFKDGKIASFFEGRDRRVVTSSIVDYVERRSQEAQAKKDAEKAA